MPSPASRYESMSDVNLVIAIGRYDQDALTEVYRRHGSAVFGLTTALDRERMADEDLRATLPAMAWLLIYREGPLDAATRTAIAGRRWIPHSLCSAASHHHRPARTSSPGATARVQGAQPMLG